MDTASARRAQAWPAADGTSDVPHRVYPASFCFRVSEWLSRKKWHPSSYRRWRS